MNELKERFQMHNIEIKADDKIVKEASEIFEALGLNLATGIEIYLRKVIDKKGIPFEVSLEVFETDTSLEDLKKHRSESFDSLETLIDEVKLDE